MQAPTLRQHTVLIHQNLPQSAVKGLADFIDKYYLTPNSRLFEPSSVRRTDRKGSVELSWKVVRPPIGGLGERKGQPPRSASFTLGISKVAVELSFDEIDAQDPSMKALYSRVTDEIQTVVWSYIQHTKMSSLYFVIGANKEQQQTESPDQRKNAQHRMTKRIFAGNATNMFLIFNVVSYVLFFVIGVYAILIIIATQFVALLYSDRIILNLGSVHPTAEQPEVTVIGVRSTPEVLRSVSAKGRQMLSEMRDEINRTVSAALLPTAVPSTNALSAEEGVRSTVLASLSRHGITVPPGDIEITSRNVYAIVERVSNRFHRPVPKITILNTGMANASATGVSSTRSSIMITAGSLEELDDDELEAVIGHELGHVKGHDPVILFGVTSFELFGRFYLWFPLFLGLGIFYLLIGFGVISFIGKFLETRADTESALIVGKPGAMASALTKIGFGRLYHEKYSPGVRLLDWFQLDPHPPLYFRIMRMSEFLHKKVVTRHTLLLSIRDCIAGFLSALFSL